MKDKKKWIIGISACVLLMVSVFFVFNQGKSNEQVVTEYFELLKKKNYKQTLILVFFFDDLVVDVL